MDKQSMKGRVAVVTGAGGTLCSAMAKRLAARGASVALLGRTEEKLKIVENEICSAGGAAVSVPADIDSEEALLAANARVLAELGPASVLINGAGGNQMGAVTTVDEFTPHELDNADPEFRGFFNLKAEALRSVININTMGVIMPSQIFGREMARTGGGAIINFGSMSSFRPLSRVPAYGLAKTGIVFLTQWLAAYLAPAGIRVNAIAPGFFLNERNRYRLTTREGGFTERGECVMRQTPMKRFGEAEDLLGTMEWLLDDNSAAFVTGITVSVDGGFLSNAGI